MVTFIITPLVAGFFTLVFSKIDIKLRGNRARKPIFLMAQPEEEAKNYNLESEVSEQKEKEESTNDDADKASVISVEDV